MIPGLVSPQIDDGGPALDVGAPGRLPVLADGLISAGEEAPSASVVGIADRLLDQVLSIPPDLSAPLRVCWRLRSRTRVCTSIN